MSDEEFLARWSRRKRQAKHGGDATSPAQALETQVPPPSRSAEDIPDAEPEISSLPSVDSITAATDVTAFLGKGIPTELSRAALRRAWASDPAIRDFVGLAENAWDFNDPQAMPGFGPLDCSLEQLGAAVDRIVGGVRSAAESVSAAVAEQREEQGDRSGPLDLKRVSLSGASTSEGNPDCAVSHASAAAVQREHSPGKNESDQTPQRGRTHGGALPR
jgi:uncharacterized protein DUF3306